jgi:hypothetical protein
VYLQKTVASGAHGLFVCPKNGHSNIEQEERALHNIATETRQDTITLAQVKAIERGLLRCQRARWHQGTGQQA